MPRSHNGVDGLLTGLEKIAADVDATVRRGTLSRYRSFATAAGHHLSGHWAFEDTRASYLLLDGLALGDDTPRLARYLLEDFSHYVSTRKDQGRKVLLLVDEFSALRLPNAAALFERLRSFNAGVVLSSQSIEGLHDEPAERDRLLNSASTLICHRLADPDPIVTRGGTTKRPERSHQLDHEGPTGAGSLRLQDTYRIDPNQLRSLPTGVAWIVSGGRAAKVAVSRGGQAVARGGRAPLVGSPRRGRREDGVVGPGDPALGRASFVAEVEESGNVEGAAVSGDPDAGPSAETESLSSPARERTPQTPAREAEPEPPVADEPSPRPARSPYAEGL